MYRSGEGHVIWSMFTRGVVVLTVADGARGERAEHVVVLTAADGARGERAKRVPLAPVTLLLLLLLAPLLKLLRRLQVVDGHRPASATPRVTRTSTK